MAGKRRASSATFLIAVLMVFSAAARAASYVYTTLDQPGFQSDTVSGVNSKGEVVGTYTTDNVNFHSFTWSNGTYTLVPDPPGQTNSQLTGIDDRGALVGYYNSADGGTGTFKVRPDGTENILRLKGGGGDTSVGESINDAFDVVGGYEEKHTLYYFQAFLNHGGVTTHLTPFSSLSSNASAITNAGEIIGTYFLTDELYPSHGFSYLNGKYTMIDPPGTTYTKLHSINERGDISGAYGSPTVYGGICCTGFIYSAGQYYTFTAPNSGETEVYAVRSLHDFVGQYSPPSGFDITRSFHYVNGHYYTLNPGGQTDNVLVFGMNGSGTLAGTYYVKATKSTPARSYGFVATCPPGPGRCYN